MERKRHVGVYSGVALVVLLTVAMCGPLVGFAGAVQEETETPRAPLSSLAGSGTLDDPYVITDADELQAMSQDLSAHYALGSDVDAGETETWNAGNGFEPIGNEDAAFEGSFDGRGHDIDGLTIIRPSAQDVGLFGGSEGTIQNVTLTNARVNGDENVGGLVGWNEGSITGSAVEGEVYGARENTGGLVGNNRGQIVACSVSATVEGEELVGGLVGFNRGPVRGSYATGTAAGEGSVGGLIGVNRNAVTASYATTTVDGEMIVGGLAGVNAGTITSTFSASPVKTAERNGSLAGRNQGTMVDVYWDAGAAGTAVTALSNGKEAGTRLTTDEMTGERASDSLDGFDFANIWTTEESYPVHQWERPDVDPLDQWQVPTPEPTPTPTPTVPGGNATVTTVGSSGVGPGFGPVSVFGALAAVVLFGRYRRRSGGLVT
ncbi:GLUG motif-containing protein [Halosimplex sp. TS25]|uniref:GLUG motif-containing protein n=1 Tax=Halosimplex rarum TaxID=3396619 RepID=UPI0039E88467